MAGEYEGCTLYDCVNRDDHHRTVWLIGEPDIDETKPVTVRGRLFVIEHLPHLIGETMFEGYLELRLTDAEVVR